ncbi:MAG: Ldh family oxidoreductase [Chloroflexi bacterium]|nr:Ldh family oxidoreductase [Chloroflexota bacterium]
MLERFHVPEDQAVHVPQAEMRRTVEEIFGALGMPEENARVAADVLLYADIRGIESHGVSNMMRNYVAGLKDGSINPAPEPKIVREAAAVATVDADRGLGLVVGPWAMQIAIERAKLYGIGAVSVGNGRHYGAAAYHAHLALEHDMIGVSMTTGGLTVLPTFGAEPMVGLNPIALAAPTWTEPAFLFDASMSSVAANKIRLAQRVGADVLPAWIADETGTPIMDERPVPEKFMMLPLGGTREIGSHKGYGLAVMVEILCGFLSGTHGGPHRRSGSAYHFIAYNIEAFTDLDEFKTDLDEYLRSLRESKTAPGHERVLYAGLPEHEEEEVRRERGIPYHPEVIEWFQGITSELSLPDHFGRR